MTVDDGDSIGAALGEFLHCVFVCFDFLHKIAG